MCTLLNYHERGNTFYLWLQVRVASRTTIMYYIDNDVLRYCDLIGDFIEFSIEHIFKKSEFNKYFSSYKLYAKEIDNQEHKQ